MASRKLKVFQAQFGFYDTVVAAPSQAAALRAWGTRQNLFASRAARLATDEAAVAAAKKHPGTPLRRAIGSSDRFAVDPTGLPEAPEAPRKRAAKPASKSRPAPIATPAADRSKLAAAEEALEVLDAARKRAETDLRREEEALKRRKEESRSAYVGARRLATAAVAQARKAYRSAGGGE